MPDLLRWVADHWPVVLLLAAVAVAAWRAAARAWPVARRVVHLVDDLTGEPARPGVDARPGVMERLRQLDDATTEHGRVLAELLPNGGGTIKDTVDRIDARTEQLAQRVEAVERVVVPDRPKATRRPRKRPEA